MSVLPKKIEDMRCLALTLTKSQLIPNFYTHLVSGQSDDSFVGLKFAENNVHLYHPESYSLDTSSLTNLRSDILKFLNTFKLTDNKTNKSSNIYDRTIIGDKFALKSYIWLLKDYLSNGLYYSRDKSFKINQSGKINWKRTYQRQAFISKRTIFYRDIISELKHNNENIITEIHKFVLKTSVQYVGWLYGLKVHIFQETNYQKEKKSFYVSILKSELNQTFDDLKKLRLTHMLKVINGLDQKDNNNELDYGLDNYYYIYEKMIDSLFSSVSDISQFYPKSVWYLKDYNNSPMNSSNLRPDTIFIQNQIAYIIDAKYYRYGFTKRLDDLPQTSSIQKQITYGDYILNNNLFGVKNVYNVFLIPFNKNSQKISNSILEHIGYAESNWRRNNLDIDQDNNLVHVFLIDLKFLIESWYKKNSFVKNELVDLLSKTRKNSI